MNPIIKDLPAMIAAKEFNATVVNAFMNQLNDMGAKLLIGLAVDSENKIQLVFHEGITISQVNQLLQQTTAELHRRQLQFE